MRYVPVLVILGVLPGCVVDNEIGSDFSDSLSDAVLSTDSSISGTSDGSVHRKDGSGDGDGHDSRVIDPDSDVSDVEYPQSDAMTWVDSSLQDANLVPNSDVSISQPDANVLPDPDADIPPDPDAEVPPDPRNVDDDHDHWTENQGDCNDHAPSVYPGAIEICNDHLDNDCNGRADFVDLVCENLPDTVITVETLGAPRAMVLNVESYDSVDELGSGWQGSSQIINESIVQVTLTAQQFPSNTFCGIRLDVSFYTDQLDVNGQGQIVGDPNRWLCEVIQGVPTVDRTIRRIRIVVNNQEFDAGDLIPIVLDGEPGCSGLLVLNDQGICALN